jgi:hypothetical protein
MKFEFEFKLHIRKDKYKVRGENLSFIDITHIIHCLYNICKQKQKNELKDYIINCEWLHEYENINKS